MTVQPLGDGFEAKTKKYLHILNNFSSYYLTILSHNEFCHLRPNIVIHLVHELNF